MHNSTVSISKGIGISLMVIGHTACPQILGHWLYSFHMPLFFFISGFLFKEKYLYDHKSYFANKIKGLYIPFVKWTLIFLLFHNFLAHINIYDNFYSWHDHIEKIIRAFTLSGSERLLGGYWFLIEALFSSMIAYAIIRIILYRHIKNTALISFKIGGGNLFILSAVSFTLVLLAYFLGNNSILIKIKSVTLLATVFFLIGYVTKNIKYRISSGVAIAILIFSLIFSFIYGDSLGIQETGYKILILPIFATSCILAIMRIAESITNNRFGKLLDFIGCNTLTILTFHFISFRIVSAFIIYRDGLPIARLADFPTIDTGNNLDWIMYSLVGIFLPLSFVLIINNVRRKIRKISTHAMI